MPAIRLAIILLIGGAAGLLLAVPLLPQKAQDWLPSASSAPTSTGSTAHTSVPKDDEAETDDETEEGEESADDEPIAEAAPVPVHKGLLLQEFRCVASRDGYKGQARITNNGKTRRAVSIEIYALAADQEELHGVRSDSKDIPNGVTVDFSHSGSYHNPSYIKYCNIRIVIPEPGFTPKNMNELFKGKYQTLKFKTAEGLELPLAFNIPSNKPPGLTGSACKPDASEYDASKDECGRTALRSGSVWQNKFTAHENNCDYVFPGQNLGIPNWEVRKAPNGIRYWSCEGPEGAQANHTVYFGALWEALEGQYGSIKCVGGGTIDWEVQKGSGEPQIESVSTVRCHQERESQSPVMDKTHRRTIITPTPDPQVVFPPLKERFEVWKSRWVAKYGDPPHKITNSYSSTITINLPMCGVVIGYSGRPGYGGFENEPFVPLGHQEVALAGGHVLGGSGVGQREYTLEVSPPQLLGQGSVTTEYMDQLRTLLDSCVLEPAPTPEPISQEGLVGHWKFDEDTGEVAKDSSEYGHDGSLVGIPTRVEGKFGGALSFDGVKDYVKISDASELRLPTTQTISTWYKWAESGADWRRLVGKGGDGKRNYGLWVNSDTGEALFQIWGLPARPGGCDAKSKVAFDTAWHHLAGTYDGARIRLYYDGRLVDDKGCTTTTHTSNHSVTIGFANGDGVPMHSPFDGLIDEVRIYNRVLTCAQIGAIANRPCRQ